MKFSIIIPSYNQGLFINQTLQSLIRQDAPSLELIVIDGGSTDESVEIIKTYERHLAYWVSEPDRGQSHAINKGLQQVTGDIVTWINSDDLLTDGALARAAEIFNELPEDVGLIHGGTIRFNDDGIIDRDFGYDGLSIERYLSGMAFSQPSAFFRRRLLDQVGYLDEMMHYGMDYDLFARMALVARFRKIDTVFSMYRIHNSSKTVTGDDKFIDDWTRTFVRVVRSLQAGSLIDRLHSLKIFDWALEQVASGYDFEFEKPELNLDLMLFYFLSYVFKSDYRNSRFDRAKLIAKYLKSQYPELVAIDYQLSTTIHRVELLPPSLIKLFRRLRALAA